MRLHGPVAPISKRLPRRHSEAIRTTPPIRLHITSFLIGSYAHKEERATLASASGTRLAMTDLMQWPVRVRATAGTDNVRSGES